MPTLWPPRCDVLDLGRPIRVLVTPGHTQGGITLIDPTYRRILTGDHVLPHINPGLGLGYADESADPIGDYFESAERLLHWDGYEVLPGHGYRFAHLATRIHAHINHHVRRAQQVKDVLRQHRDATVWQVATALTWSTRLNEIGGHYIVSALSQTAMHMRFVEDHSRSDRWLQHPAD